MPSAAAKQLPCTTRSEAAGICGLRAGPGLPENPFSAPELRDTLGMPINGARETLQGAWTSCSTADTPGALPLAGRKSEAADRIEQCRGCLTMMRAAIW